jgi:hypothetical protein
VATALIESMSAFFIVGDVDRIIAFCREMRGFETHSKEPDEHPYRRCDGRGGAALFFKAGEAEPLPNAKRDPAGEWDA